MACPTRRGGECSSSVIVRESVRASPVTEIDMTGAPQPSTPTCCTASPASASTCHRIACCSGCIGSRYVFSGQPLTWQVRSMAACLPEQVIAIRDGCRPSLTHTSRSRGSSG